MLRKHTCIYALRELTGLRPVCDRFNPLPQPDSHEKCIACNRKVLARRVQAYQREQIILDAVNRHMGRHDDVTSIRESNVSTAPSLPSTHSASSSTMSISSSHNSTSRSRRNDSAGPGEANKSMPVINHQRFPMPIRCPFIKHADIAFRADFVDMQSHETPEHLDQDYLEHVDKVVRYLGVECLGNVL